MAQPVEFHGQNGVLGVQKESEHNVDPLPVFRNGRSCISCWELSDAEMEEIIKTKRVYVSVFYGLTQPPIFIGSETNVRAVNADYGVWRK